jgi:transcription elongation factor GreB
MDSPVGRALMRKKLEDAVTVQRPAGQTHYVITGIRYTEEHS